MALRAHKGVKAMSPVDATSDTATDRVSTSGGG